MKILRCLNYFTCFCKGVLIATSFSIRNMMRYIYLYLCVPAFLIYLFSVENDRMFFFSLFFSFFPHKMFAKFYIFIIPLFTRGMARNFMPQKNQILKANFRIHNMIVNKQYPFNKPNAKQKNNLSKRTWALGRKIFSLSSLHLGFLSSTSASEGKSRKVKPTFLHSCQEER